MELTSAYHAITNLPAPADKHRLIPDPHQFPLAVGGQGVGVGFIAAASYRRTCPCSRRNENLGKPKSTTDVLLVLDPHIRIWRTPNVVTKDSSFKIRASVLEG